MSLADAQVARQCAKVILWTPSRCAASPYVSAFGAFIPFQGYTHTVRVVAIHCGHLGVPRWKPSLFWEKRRR
jgi:hypothetical protein